MDVLSICRICLIENVNMQILNNVSLQRTYEKLTEIPFMASDRRPLKVCYICYTKLRNCYQLQTSCLQSEELLSQMLKNNELKPQLQDAKRLKIVHPVIQFSVGLQEQKGHECASENVSYIKMEPSELSVDVSVKEEEFEDESDIVNDEMIVHIQPKEVLKCDELDINVDEDFSIQNQEPNGNLMSKSDDLCMNDNTNLYYRPQAIEIQGVPVPKAMSLENSQIVYGKKPKIEENESMVMKIPSIYNTNVQQSSLNICVKEVASAESLKCDTCGKCFNRRCNLLRHVLIHSEEEIDVVSLDCELPMQLRKCAVSIEMLASGHNPLVIPTVTTTKLRRSSRKVVRKRPHSPPCAVRRRKEKRNIVNHPSISPSEKRRKVHDRCKNRLFTDIDYTDSETAQRSYHSIAERLRRVGLQCLFNELRSQIPSINSRKITKITILREATALCTKYKSQEFELKNLQKKRQQLIIKLNKLRKNVLRHLDR